MIQLQWYQVDKGLKLTLTFANLQNESLGTNKKCLDCVFKIPQRYDISL